jgi:hypothetical protein
MSLTLEKRKISLHFHPFEVDSCNHVVEKAVGEEGNQSKKRYLIGVSSGMKLDQHGERMTKECIEDMMKQANEGTILLYPDIHGIKASEDIGKLVKAKILPNGDWYTEYVLYDKEDGIGERKLETIDTIWSQINGLPPYSKPIQKGFSIEGLIPENEILSKNKQGGERVINKVELDGVILCPRPAYQDGIANGVFKALGVLPPWEENRVKKSIENKLRKVIQDRDQKDQFFKKKFDVDASFEETIEEIMSDFKPNKKERLEVLFGEYQDIMINLLLNSIDLFQVEQIKEVPIVLAKQENREQVVKVLTDITSSLVYLTKNIKQFKRKRRT